MAPIRFYHHPISGHAHGVRLFMSLLQLPFEAIEIASRLFKRMDQHLATQLYLAGAQPTIADLPLYTCTAHAPEEGVSRQPYAQLRAWLQRIEAQPHFVGMVRHPALA